MNSTPPGIDQEGDDEEQQQEQEEEEYMEEVDNPTTTTTTTANNDNDENMSMTLAKNEARELDAARKERLELIAAEQKKIRAPQEGAATKEDKLNYLLSQSEVFAHFLAGE